MSQHFDAADLGELHLSDQRWHGDDLADADAEQMAGKVTALASLLPDDEAFTWGHLRRWLPDWRLEARRAIFGRLPHALQISAWHEARTDRAELVDPADDGRRGTVVPLRTRRRGDTPLDGLIDAVNAIPAPQYVEAIARVEVPDHGGTIRCPLPGHDDNTPSFTVYQGTRGWYCFGCGAGGGPIDLHAAMTNQPTAGRGFPALVRELADTLMRGAA